MDLEIKNTFINLSAIKFVKDTWLSYNGSLTVHLGCDQGKESELAGLLPKVIHETFEVVESDKHVFLRQRETT